MDYFLSFLVFLVIIAAVFFGSFLVLLLIPLGDSFLKSHLPKGIAEFFTRLGRILFVMFFVFLVCLTAVLGTGMMHEKLYPKEQKGQSMGMIAHKCLIVTGWDKGQYNAAFSKARELFNTSEHILAVENPVVALNSNRTFVVTPDGSKEGWEESDAVDELIEEMIQYLSSPDCTFEGEGTSLDWVLVEYGDRGAMILKTNTKNKY